MTISMEKSSKLFVKLYVLYGYAHVAVLEILMPDLNLKNKIKMKKSFD